MAAAAALLEEVKAFKPVTAAGRPVFRWDRAGYAMFYAPGCLCVVSLADAEWFEGLVARPEAPSGCAPDAVQWGTELRHRAELAVAGARQWQEAPFGPECLTLYVNNECNLGCVYCYADPAHEPAVRLETEAVAIAAEVVAKHCRRKGRPFYAVFHGGGEPTLHREQVEGTLSLLESVAAAHDVELFRYVATSGVMSQRKALWLARRFDLVGLSCDGPPDMQNAHRPRWGGGPTAGDVERTARILHAEGQKVHVRATITSLSVRRQAEIVAYLCEKLFPEEIHFEPMYAGGRADMVRHLDLLEATEFVDHFLQARRKAQAYSVPLSYAGCRLDQVHGPYCNVFRQVLNLVPGGVATACFKVTDARQARVKGLAIGALDEKTGHFAIDHARVRDLRQRLAAAPAQCHACFNQFHCARGCPEICSLGSVCSSSDSSQGLAFRCQVQKAIAAASLQEAADVLWSASAGTGEDRRVYGTAIL
jgi:sulfatase maturation enzyme AslB (radical SAM superfamily)